MPYCKQCGNPVDVGHHFCPSCGSTSATQHNIAARTGITITANTSGQGKNAVLPPEIKGWAWGAFLIPIFWGIGNRVWIALLCFVPYVGFVMVIVLGIKGNEWAWRSKKWDSVEHFRRTQKTWEKWGWILTIFVFLLPILFLAIVD